MQNGWQNCFSSKCSPDQTSTYILERIWPRKMVRWHSLNKLEKRNRKFNWYFIDKMVHIWTKPTQSYWFWSARRNCPLLILSHDSNFSNPSIRFHLLISRIISNYDFNLKIAFDLVGNCCLNKTQWLRSHSKKSVVAIKGRHFNSRNKSFKRETIFRDR